MAGRRLRRLVAITTAAVAVAGLWACGSRGPTTVAPGPSATTATPAATSQPSTTSGPPARPPTAGPTSGVAERVAGRDWERIPTDDRVVALTFDAGANADALPSILATLARLDVPATFFLTGDWVEAHPAQARQIADAAHAIGNHSLDHPHFPRIGDTQARRQVTAAAATIRGATGVDPRPFFRFPYGDRTRHDIELVNGLGFVPVRWTVDSLGWKGTSGGLTADAVADRVVAAAAPGEIVLMHVGSNPDDATMLDADALPRVVARLRALGYGFVTLHALTG